MDIHDIELELIKIINELKNAGLIAAETSTKLLASKTLDQLKNAGIDLSGLKLKDPALKNALTLCTMAAQQDDIHQQFNPRFLFDRTLNKEELTQTLRLIFEKFFKLTPKEKNFKQEELDARLNKLINLVTEALLKKDKNFIINFLASALNEINQLSKRLRLKPKPAFKSDELDAEGEFLLSMYGCDTRRPGSISSLLRAIPRGNAVGVIDLASYGPSFMGQQDNPNPGLEDEMGIHLRAALGAIATGAMSQGLERELEAAHYLKPEPEPTPSHTHTPFSTKPVPKQH